MKASLQILPQNVISPIDPRIYSSFIEHMGRAVYTGIYEPDHPEADGLGFRRDVAEKIRKLNLSHIRYPGGNFLSGYRWEDGIGPREQRPVRRELAWFSLEPNYVGINEFVTYCREVGVEPMIGVNLGTRGPQDAANLLEYCNVPGGTYYSDLRRSHGYEQPHNIRLWCLGNEMDGPWQICAKTAEEYGRIACETAKMMKWMDDTIELVVCGSSNRTMPTFGQWEKTVLKHCYEYVDYLSLHQYYQNQEGDLPAFLARSEEMGQFIEEVAAICREEKARRNSDHDVFLSFDEWNVWYHFQEEGKIPEKWIFPRPIEEEKYNLADALLVGSMLNTLINHSDVVKVACMAQLVNVLAPIMTEPGGKSWVQTSYYPLYYASQYGRGKAIEAHLDCPRYACQLGEVPYLDCAAVLREEEREIALFVVNRSREETAELQLTLQEGKTIHGLEQITLTGEPEAVNTLSETPILPQEAALLEGSTLTLAPMSWNLIRVRIL